MASLVLSAAGQALGESLLGNAVLGGLLTGAQVGGLLGAAAGMEIDAALMPGRTVNRTGPRLSDIAITASTEGAPIPRLFGRMRLAGQLIWATRFRETATASSTSAGGKGGGATTVNETDYSYSISFAVGLCEGEATKLGRIWANDDTQVPDDFGFRTGGARSIRGYKYQSIGLHRDGAVVGAPTLLVGSVEYDHYFDERWGVGVFVDAGDAAESFGAMQWAVGYGVGALMRTPAGPFFIDLAYGQRDHKLRLQFSLGIAF